MSTGIYFFFYCHFMIYHQQFVFVVKTSMNMIQITDLPTAVPTTNHTINPLSTGMLFIRHRNSLVQNLFFIKNIHTFYVIVALLIKQVY